MLLNRQYRSYDYDLDADGFEVASHAHKQGKLQSGSAFSRGTSNQRAGGDAPQTRRAPQGSAAGGRDAQLSSHPASLTTLEQNRADFDRRYQRDAYAQNPGGEGRSRRRASRAARTSAYEGGAGRSASNGRQLGRQLDVLSRKRHGLLKFFLLVVAVLTAVYAFVFWPIDAKLAFKEPEATQVAHATQMHIPLQPYYVLLLGSDARASDDISRADSIILARVDVLANKITLLSIPRDTKVELPDHGTQKINAAYAFGGASGMVEAVSSLVGVPIAKVAVIHFDGLSSLVDAVGGITVDVPVEVYDPDYTGLMLSPGPQKMDGKTALLFSRVRHGFALGDFQRQADQMLVLQALMKKLRGLPPVDALHVANSLADNMDSSLRCYNLLPLMLRMLAGSPTIYRASLPSTTDDSEGISYVINDKAETARLMDVINAGGNPADVDIQTGLE